MTHLGHWALLAAIASLVGPAATVLNPAAAQTVVVNRIPGGQIEEFGSDLNMQIVNCATNRFVSGAYTLRPRPGQQRRGENCLDLISRPEFRGCHIYKTEPPANRDTGPLRALQRVNDETGFRCPGQPGNIVCIPIFARRNDRTTGRTICQLQLRRQ